MSGADPLFPTVMAKGGGWDGKSFQAISVLIDA